MNSQSYEVEIKVHIRDPITIEASLISLGAKKTHAETQIDAYFNHPCRSFGDTDETLRIRQIEDILPVSDNSVHTLKTEVTYKGPKIDSTTKTRLELSLGIEDIDVGTSILEELGFQSVGLIKKRRTYFELESTIISIDEVDDIGLFLELERVVDSKEMIPSAKNIIFSQLEKLGIKQTDSIRESYLEFYFRKQHS